MNGCRRSAPDRGLVIGREVEFGSIAEIFDQRAAFRGLVIEGDVGIGKTVVWREVVSQARDRGLTVLISSPREPEAALAFSALGDLLEPVLETRLPQLTAARRRALEQALLLAGPVRRREAQPRAIGLAVRDLLSELARDRPLAIAIDDAHWLDRASASALGFALRRLEQAAVVLLLAKRVDRGGTSAASLVTDGIDASRLRLVELGPLSLGAVGHIIRSRFEVPYPRPTLRRIYDLAGGNPLFALEIARSLRGDSAVPSGALTVLPVTLQAVVGARLAELSDAARLVALVVAALADPTVETIREALGDPPAGKGLTEALDGDVLVVERGQIRFTHPLLASVAYSGASPEARRRIHLRLAEVVESREERARHLLAVTVGPDEAVAVEMEHVARSARGRGSPQTAAELAERAADLTSSHDPEGLCRRLLLAGEYTFAAGDSKRAITLLERACEVATKPSERVATTLALASATFDGVEVSAGLAIAEQALTEARHDPLLEARALARIADLNFDDFPKAAKQANDALDRLDRATTTNPEVEATALKARAVAGFYSGRGLDLASLERAEQLEHEEATWERVALRARCVRGMLLERAGQLAKARVLLEDARRLADDEGDEGSIPDISCFLAELELLAGEWPTAEKWIDEVADSADSASQTTWQAIAEGLRARIGALRGEEHAARASAAQSLALVGHSIPGDHALVAIGSLELSLGNLEAADTAYAALDRMAADTGLVEPSAWKYDADWIETLVGLGRIDDASALLTRVDGRSTAARSPWTIGVVGRSRGLLAATTGDAAGALVALERSQTTLERASMPFERARTALVTGRIQRRGKQRKAARESLTTALATFERLGAKVWAARTREELSRIAGRRPPGDTLTPTEARIAELVAAGSANKAVAARLNLTVHTVEINLTRIYAKLGISSRGQLRDRLQSEERKM